MKFHWVDTTGFGRLTGRVEFARDKVNVVCAPNESGKTTLAYALIYALFGMAGDRGTKNRLSARERFKPWTGARGNFGVRLKLEIGAGELYEVDASFGSQPVQTVHFGGKAETYRTQSWGQEILGLGQDGFMQACFVRQDPAAEERLNRDPDDLLSGLLERVATQEQAKTSSTPAATALAALQDAKVALPPLSPNRLKVKTVMSRVQKRHEEVSSALAKLRDELEEYDEALLDAESIEEKIAELVVEKRERERQLASLDVADARQALEQLQASDEQFAKYSARLKELQPFAEVRPDTWTQVSVLLAKYREAVKALEAARLRWSEDVERPRAALEGKLAQFPAGIDSQTESDLGMLGAKKSDLLQGQAELERAEDALKEAHATAMSAGVDLAGFQSLKSRFESLSPDEQATVRHWPTRKAELAEARMELQGRLRELEEKSAASNAVKAQQAKQQTQAIGILVAGAILIMAARLYQQSQGGVPAGAVMLALLGIGLGAAGLRLRSKARGRDVDEQVLLREADAELAKLRAELDSNNSTQTHENAQFTSLCERAGLAEKDLETLRDSLRLSQAAQLVEAKQAEVYRLRAQLEGARMTVSGMLAGWMPTAQEHVTAQVVTDAMQKLQSHLGLRAQRDDLARLDAELTKAIAEYTKSRDEARAQIVVLAPEYNPDAADAAAQEAALAQASEHARAYRDLLAQTAPKAVDAATMSAANAKLEEATARFDALTSHGAADTTQWDASGAGMSRGALVGRIREIDEEATKLKTDRAEVFSARQQAREKMIQQGGDLEDELDLLTRQLVALQRFEQATALAAKLLEEEQASAYSAWAEGVGEAMEKCFPVLTGGRYSSLRVDRDLRVRVRPADGAELSDTKLDSLSRGTYDQLLFALRLAVCDYLGRDAGRLPLILDEPFAHWDDERFERGMELLAEVSQRHQVLLLTCHESRLEDLRTQRPELAERLHFVTLTSA